MKQIVFVCLGNICRSPMAEFVMKNLTDQYRVESRATSNWEHGNPIHQGTQKIFQKHQVPYDLTKTSLQIKDKDFYDFDLILGMKIMWQISSKWLLQEPNTRSICLQVKVSQTLGIRVILMIPTAGFWLDARPGWTS